jgi:hypothetical protein
MSSTELRCDTLLYAALRCAQLRYTELRCAARCNVAPCCGELISALERADCPPAKVMGPTGTLGTLRLPSTPSTPRGLVRQCRYAERYVV